MKNTNIFLALNYFVTYGGLSTLYNSYLKLDRPPLSHYFLIGLVSVFLTFVIHYFTKGQSSEAKVFVIIAVAIVLIGSSFLLA
ncbi:MAG: hypothetical protein WAU36_06965 [Cyclobacteriaceae bacterium]